MRDRQRCKHKEGIYEKGSHTVDIAITIPQKRIVGCHKYCTKAAQEIQAMNSFDPRVQPETVLAAASLRFHLYLSSPLPALSVWLICGGSGRSLRLGPHDAGGNPYIDSRFSDVARDNGTCTDGDIRTDGHPLHNRRIGAQPDLFAQAAPP